MRFFKDDCLTGIWRKPVGFLLCLHNQILANREYSLARISRLCPRFAAGINKNGLSPISHVGGCFGREYAAFIPDYNNWLVLCQFRISAVASSGWAAISSCLPSTAPSSRRRIASASSKISPFLHPHIFHSVCIVMRTQTSGIYIA